MSIKRTHLNKNSYADRDDFGRDLHAGGGPGLGDLDNLQGSGPHFELLRAIWGTSKAAFEEAANAEAEAEQRRRPHIFVTKRTRY